MHPKILSLLQTGSPSNISLALRLLEQQKRESPAQEFSSLYHFLIFNTEDQVLRTAWDLQLEAIFSIKELRMVHQGLSELPERLGLMQQLRGLLLGSNNFEEIPVCIFQLNKLRALHLNDNRLKSLPKEIKQLQQLETLDLSDNRLTSVQDSLSSLHLLKSCLLTGNDISRQEQDALQEQLPNCYFLF